MGRRRGEREREKDDLVGRNLPDISSISTWDASILDLRVAEMDSDVTPEVLASAAAWVSVGAAMARRDRVTV